MGKQLAPAKGPLLFSVGKKDLVFETFRCGGHGGQNVNKVETGVRIRHPDSGAVAESREHASQHANRKAAFMRLAHSEKFQKWHRIETARRLGHAVDLDDQVDRMMAPGNLKVETRAGGRWVAEAPGG